MLSIENHKLFYNAYILPHFDYCCIIWGTCNTALDYRLVRFQKRAARLILDLYCLTPSALLLNTLRWMAFPEWIVYQKALQMYKTIHCDAPDDLITSFTFTSEIHTRLLRSVSTCNLYTPRPRHEIFRTSCTCSGASVWSSLPVNIQNASNVKQFKSLYLRLFKISAT